MTARREHLLDLAERVLEREGLGAFGVNALAREAGIKPPSVYKHFAGTADLQHALISRWFRRLAAALDAAALDAAEPSVASVASFAAAYRAVALGAPQLYRLATDGPLDRAMLDPGSERAAMAATLRLFGEHPEDADTGTGPGTGPGTGTGPDTGANTGPGPGTSAGTNPNPNPDLVESEGADADHHRSRLAWAAAHGLVSLEIAGRFPPGTDLDAAWRALAATLSG